MLTRNEVNKINVEVLAAVEAIAKRHGMTPGPGRCSFDPHAGVVQFKMEIGITGETGYRLADMNSWTVFARIHPGLPAELGEMFMLGGQTYTIIGVKSRGGARPILAKRDDNGRTYCLSIDAVRHAFVFVTNLSSGGGL
jgi:hypothetical protein